MSTNKGPLGSILVVEPFKKETEKNGFVISANQEYMPEKGKVLSIGSKVSNINVGDDILFQKGAYSKVTIDGKEVLLVDEAKVYYVL